MKCPYCREESPQGNNRCLSCGKLMRKGNTSGKREDHVHDYLVESILVTLFCCQPFGIVAMIICHAGKVVSLGRIS